MTWLSALLAPSPVSSAPIKLHIYQVLKVLFICHSVSFNHFILCLVHTQCINIFAKHIQSLNIQWWPRWWCWV